MASVNFSTMDTERERRVAPQPKTAAVTDWVRERLRLLSWIVPLAMLVIVVGYEIGPSRWLYERYGFEFHLVAELIIFATVGPALAFAILQLLQRWLEERDTSELQAALLARSRAEAEGSRQLNDDALQVLFAAGVLIDTLKSSNQELPPELVAQVDDTERALREAVAQLRGHLLKESG